MTLDDKLRQTGAELDQAVSGRRPDPPGLKRTRMVGGPLVAVATAAAILVPAMVLSLLLFADGSPSLGPAGQPTDTSQTVATTTTVPEDPADRAAPTGDGLSQVDDLPEGWNQRLGTEATVLLAEEGVAIAYSPSDEVGSHTTWDMSWPSTDNAESRPYVVGLAGDLPDTIVWILDRPNEPTRIFGIVPYGTTAVEFDVEGLPHATTDLVYQRQAADRAVFVATVDELTLGSDTGLMLQDDSGNWTSVELERGEDTAESEPEDTISLLALRVAQPLIVATTDVDGLPETISCQAPEGITAPPNREGSGDDVAYDSAAAALQRFVSVFEGDPPIAASGYHELTVDGQTIGFGVEFKGGDGYVTVVAVNQVTEGWAVERWSATGC